MQVSVFSHFAVSDFNTPISLSVSVWALVTVNNNPISNTNIDFNAVVIVYNFNFYSSRQILLKTPWKQINLFVNKNMC